MTVDHELLEIRRSMIDPEKLFGFGLARSGDLMLINPINSDYMKLNGYTVIRNSDVSQCKRLGRNSFMYRALLLNEVQPLSAARISLTSWVDLLRSANQLFPLITIRQEALDREVCYIGRLALTTEHSFSLREINPGAKWRGRPRRYYFRNLTKVDFGGGYEEALWRVAGDDLDRR